MDKALVFTGEQVPVIRMIALKGALKLETLGMQPRGRSAYSIIKQEFGLKGTRASVLEQFTAMVEKAKAGRNNG